MLLTPHTIVGLAIGSTIKNTPLGFFLSVFMHFAGDLVPHWDFYSGTTKEDRRTGWRPLAVMADLICGVAIGLSAVLFSLWVKQSPEVAFRLFACGIGSVLPDALEGPHIYFSKEPKILKIISKMQGKLQFQAPLPWGIISQLAVMAFSLLIILESLL